MKILFSPIRGSLHTTALGGGATIRIFNKSGRTIPGKLISDIVQLARKVHQFHKAGSDKPMHEYTRGECHSVALMFRTNARQFIEGLRDTEIIRGIEVLGSNGYIKGHDEIFGIHHLTLLCLDDIYIGVDPTVAQLYKANAKFKKTEALIIVTEANDAKFVKGLKEVYGGGQWLFVPWGF